MIEKSEIRSRRINYRQEIWSHRINTDEKVMEIIDKQRMVDRDIYSFKGSKPGPRSRNKKKGTSRRRPPTGLPRSLYDKDWLKTQTMTQVRKLHISKNKFVWMRVGSRKTTES